MRTLETKAQLLAYIDRHAINDKIDGSHEEALRWWLANVLVHFEQEPSHEDRAETIMNGRPPMVIEDELKWVAEIWDDDEMAENLRDWFGW